MVVDSAARDHRSAQHIDICVNKGHTATGDDQSVALLEILLCPHEHDGDLLLRRHFLEHDLMLRARALQG